MKFNANFDSGFTDTQMMMMINLDIRTVPTTKSGALQNVDRYLGFCLFFYTLTTYSSCQV